jgi:prophage regulatory protein
MSDRFLRYNDLREKGVPWCRMHLDRMEKAGKFPKRVRLGAGTVAWVEGEIDAFMACKIAERDARAQPSSPDTAGIAA